jgi:hypothetical protein
MTVVKVLSTNKAYRTYTGTSTEVINALDTDRIPMSNVISVYWDATANKAVAVVHKGSRS